MYNSYAYGEAAYSDELTTGTTVNSDHAVSVEWRGTISADPDSFDITAGWPD